MPQNGGQMLQISKNGALNRRLEVLNRRVEASNRRPEAFDQPGEAWNRCHFGSDCVWMVMCLRRNLLNDNRLRGESCRMAVDGIGQLITPAVSITPQTAGSHGATEHTYDCSGIQCPLG